MEERWRAIQKTSWVNRGLIILNIIYFIYLEIAGSSENVLFMAEHGALYGPFVWEQGEYYRLVTSMFMHFGIRHIINNMIVLWALGDNLERALGHLKYFVFYLCCGIGANSISMAVSGSNAMVVSAGASGAIFGVVGGLLYAVIANRGQLEDLSAQQLMFMVVLSLYMGYASSGVDNTAHVSGLILGILFGIFLYRKPEKYYGQWRNQR